MSAASVAGKSTALRVVGTLCPRPLMLAQATLRPLLRLIDSAHPTLLIDEADRWALTDHRMRRLLVSGHARDGLYLDGGESPFEEPAWSCFTPCAVTLTRPPPTDFAKRCITITLMPALADERPAPFPVDRSPAEFAPRCARLVRWARDHGAAAMSGEGEMPGLGADGRNWRPLFAIAQHAGTGWVERAEASCRGLAQAELDRPLEIQLLADIRVAFGAADRLTTEALLKVLLADDERPWRRPERGRALDARLLAGRLARFGIRPRVIRMEGEAFARATSGHCVYTGDGNVTAKTAVFRGCDAVTDVLQIHRSGKCNGGQKTFCGPAETCRFE